MQELEQIANAFAGSLRAKDSVRSGWGQFIGGAANQVGLYGTCAGLICFGYAGRVPLSSVTAYIDQVWNAPEDHDRKYLSQTARLAFLVIALSVFPGGASQGIASAASQTLKDRRLANGLWPAWGVSGHPNQKSSVVATSLALIALNSEAKNDPSLRALLSESAKRLAEQLPSPDGGQASPLLPLCAISMTLDVADIPRDTKVHIRREISRMRSTSEIEFEFIDYGVEMSGSLTYGRDYFYVPAVTLQLALASMLSGKWVVAHENAKRLLDVVRRAVTQSGFQREHSDYVASLDQAWTSWALNMANSRSEPKLYVVRATLYRFIFSHRPVFLRDGLIPLIIGGAAALASQNPSLLLGYSCNLGQDSQWFCAVPETQDITKLKNIMQSIGILVGFTFGSLFLWRIAAYAKHLYERFSR